VEDGGFLPGSMNDEAAISRAERADDAPHQIESRFQLVIRTNFC